MRNCFYGESREVGAGVRESPLSVPTRRNLCRRGGGDPTRGALGEWARRRCAPAGTDLTPAM